MIDTERNDNPIKILLVEDNPGDVRLTQEVFKQSNVKSTLYVTKDGAEALDFLRHDGTIRPDIILLDLNLPKKNGNEVLAEIKQDPELKCSPVVILTTSKSELDILRAYDLYANCFITKPVDLDEFIRVVKGIENFWMSIVRLPPKYQLESCYKDQ